MRTTTLSILIGKCYPREIKFIIIFIIIIIIIIFMLTGIQTQKDGDRVNGSTLEKNGKKSMRPKRGQKVGLLRRWEVGDMAINSFTPRANYVHVRSSNF